MPVSSQDFRAALSRFASGVTIITAVQGGEQRGMTASAFVSVSLSPPLILVSVDKRAAMHAVLDEGQAFAVNILSQSQQLLSDHFAGRPDPGLRIPWQELGGLPVLGGAAAQLACTTYARYPRRRPHPVRGRSPGRVSERQSAAGPLRRSVPGPGRRARAGSRPDGRNAVKGFKP